MWVGFRNEEHVQMELSKLFRENIMSTSSGGRAGVALGISGGTRASGETSKMFQKRFCREIRRCQATLRALSEGLEVRHTFFQRCFSAFSLPASLLRPDSLSPPILVVTRIWGYTLYTGGHIKQDLRHAQKPI